MVTPAEFSWSERKRLDGVAAQYLHEGIDRTITVVLTEGRSQFENDDDATRYQRIASVELDAAEVLDSDGRLVIAGTKWQLIKPIGRDDVSQDWQVGNTINKRKRSTST